MSQVHLSIYTALRTHKEKQMTTAIEVNCETGEVIERPLTADEIAANEAAAAQAEADRVTAEAEAAVKAQAKAALLEKLGISEDEAKLLLG
jgi:hypothetical protein